MANPGIIWGCRSFGGPPRWAYNKKLLDTKARRIRLQVIPNNLAPTLDAFVLANVEPGTVILTDDNLSYVNLSRLGYTHAPKTVGLMAAHVVLPWVHRVFARLKRWGLGVYHGLRRKHVQTYLDEYCFRFNRRHWRRVSFEISHRGAGIGGKIIYFAQKTGAPKVRFPPNAVIQLRIFERLFLPHSGHCPRRARTAQEGGNRTCRKTSL